MASLLSTYQMIEAVKILRLATIIYHKDYGYILNNKDEPQEDIQKALQIAKPRYSTQMIQIHQDAHMDIRSTTIIITQKVKCYTQSIRRGITKDTEKVTKETRRSHIQSDNS